MSETRTGYAIDKVDWDDPLSYVREMYRVPARTGRRVVYCGKPATIVGAEGAHLLIKGDGEQSAWLVHPTWKMQYLDD